MSDYGASSRFTTKYYSPKVETMEQVDALRFEINERMRTALSRRHRINRDAQNLMEKIMKYWKDKGFQPPVLWVENDGVNHDLPSFIRSNMIGGLPQVKLHDGNELAGDEWIGGLKND